MEMKSYKIINMYKTLEKLTKENVDLKTAVKLARNFEAITTPTKIIEEKQQNLMKEYAKKDENGEVIQNKDNTVTIENLNEYFPKLNEILETELEVELQKIKIDNLEGVKLSAQDILAIDDMLEDDEKKEDTDK